MLFQWYELGYCDPRNTRRRQTTLSRMVRRRWWHGACLRSALVGCRRAHTQSVADSPSTRAEDSFASDRPVERKNTSDAVTLVTGGCQGQAAVLAVNSATSGPRFSSGIVSTAKVANRVRASSALVYSMGAVAIRTIPAHPRVAGSRGRTAASSRRPARRH